MRLVGSCSDDKSVKLWDLNTQKLLISFNQHTNIVKQTCFSPDGTCLISGSFDKNIKVVDIRSKRVIQEYNNAHDD